jgi:adenylate cyclase
MTDRPTWRSALVIVAGAAVLGVYLFVQAPAPLSAANEQGSKDAIPIRTVLALLEQENAAARALWTEDIVNAGKGQGLAFEETWREDAVHAGPLPALFLRETARRLERTSPGLRLFLGSPHPINAANRFSGDQATYFARVATDGQPQFFVDPETRLQTAMFADRAIVDACARCHNEHAESPKQDWKVNDIMGATTWMYPADVVSPARALEMISALRGSIRGTYESYLEKAKTFPKPPVVGDAWPRTGNQLPSADVFMRELAERSSARTLRGLLGQDEPERKRVPPPAAPAVAPAIATPPLDVLVIRAKRSTRVAVEYAGVRLVVARLRAGAMTTVSSPPPLRVHVESADSVALEYRGKPITGAGEVEVVMEGGEDR